MRGGIEKIEDRERNVDEEERNGRERERAFVGTSLRHPVTVRSSRTVFQKYRIKYEDRERKKEQRGWLLLLYLVDVATYFIFRWKYRFEGLFLDDSIFLDTFDAGDTPLAARSCFATKFLWFLVAHCGWISYWELIRAYALVCVTLKGTDVRLSMFHRGKCSVRYGCNFWCDVFVRNSWEIFAFAVQMWKWVLCYFLSVEFKIVSV